MNTIDINTLDTNTIRAARRRTALAIAVVLVLSLAAITVVAAETNVSSGGIPAWLGDYLTEVGEALAAG